MTVVFQGPHGPLVRCAALGCVTLIPVGRAFCFYHARMVDKPLAPTVRAPENRGCQTFRTSEAHP